MIFLRLAAVLVVPLLASCALDGGDRGAISEPRRETLAVDHGFGDRNYTVTLLPDLDGVTFVTGDGEKLFLPGEPMARLAVSGGGIRRQDRDLALAIVRDFCAGRREFACRSFGRVNGGPIFVEGRWLLQFARTG